MNTNVQLNNEILKDPLLIKRGIAQSAYVMRWTSESYRWVYPVFDFDGNIITYRTKSYDSNASRKYTWKPNSNGAKYYHHPEIRQHIADANGVLYIANGEPSVLAYHAVGIYNVLCWFGEGNIPSTFIEDINELGATSLIYAPDNDEAGRKSASKLRDLLHDKDIPLTVLDISAHVDRKGDTNNLWMNVEFDRDHFIDTLKSCPPLVLPAYEAPKPKPTYTYHPDDNLDAKEQLFIRLGVYGTPTDKNGWTRKKICNPLRDDKHPSMNINLVTGVGHDWGSDTNHSPKELCEYFGIEWNITRQNVPQASNMNAIPDDATDSKTEAKSKPPIKDRIRPVQTHKLKDAHSVNTQFINNEVFKNNNFIVLKSGMGTGKTQACVEYAKSNPHASLLVITPFETLTVSASNLYEIESYKNYDADMLQRIPRLAITAKSLDKLIQDDGTIPQFDIIIIDEVDQNLQQYNSTLYTGGEAPIALDALSKILNSAKQIIVTSAHVTQLDIDTLKTLSGKTNPYIIENTHRRDMPKLTLHDDMKLLIRDALTRAKQSDNPVLIACGGLKTARLIRRLATNHFGIDERDVFLLSSRNSHSTQAREIINAPNQYIPKYKLLIFTFAAGVGMSYTGGCAGMYGIFNNRGMTPQQDLQMMERPRKADMYHAHIQSSYRDLETNPQTLYKRIQRNYSATQKMANLSTAIKPENTQLAQIGTQYQAQNNISKTDKLSSFAAYAKEQGHELAYCDEEAPISFKTTWKENREQFKEEEKQKTLTIPYRLSSDEFKQKRMNRTLDELDFYARLADIIEQTTGFQLQEKLYDRFYTQKKRSQFEFFTDVFARSQNDMKKIDRLEAHDHTSLLQRTHSTLKHTWMIKLLLELAGVKHLSDVPEALKNIEELLQVEWLDKIKAFMLLHEQTLKEVFKWRKDLSPDPFAFLQWMLSRIGLKLRRGTRSSEGTRKYRYFFDDVNFEVTKQYAIHRRNYLNSDDKILSISRIETVFKRDMDIIVDDNQAKIDYQRWKEQIDNIPI
jgi:hypothetical protein